MSARSIHRGNEAGVEQYRNRLQGRAPAVVIAATVSVLVGTFGLAAGPNAEAEKVVIARVITDSIAWALTKDRALQESTMAHDPDLFYFWVDSKSTITGWEQHLTLFEIFMDPRFKATHTEVRDLRITLSRSGDVAWYSALLDDLGEWDGRQVGARDIRWTGVLEKREGAWVIVQMHASLAADTVREEALKKAQAEETGGE